MATSLASAKLLLSEAAKRILRKVDPSQRKAIQEALRRFQQDPLDSRLRFEKYVGFENLYTIRATYGLRVYMIDEGDMMMQIVHIGNHDFAKRRR